MATEKTWFYRTNVNCNGDDLEDVQQNWMFNLFTMLSGGNGNPEAKWEILSASDGSTVAEGGTNITSPSDFSWANAGSAHSWFVARKSGSLLPDSGSGDRYIYFGADCENTYGYQACFTWDYEIPSTAGTTLNRPDESAMCYQKDAQWFMPNVYDAGNPIYFHGIIDTTGSFHVITSQSGLNYVYPFAMSTARFETPRAITVDPFPVYMKIGYLDHASYRGPWDLDYYRGTSTQWYNTTPNTPTAGTWVNSPVDGFYGAGMAQRDTNDYCMLLCPYGNSSYDWNSYYGFKTRGDSLDASWPLMSQYVQDVWHSNEFNSIRGRLPDIHPSGQYYSYGGAVMPGTGSVQFCWIGDIWMPATGSMLPGV